MSTAPGTLSLFVESVGVPTCALVVAAERMVVAHRAIRILHPLPPYFVEARDALHALVPAVVEEHDCTVLDDLAKKAVGKPRVATHAVSKVENPILQVIIWQQLVVQRNRLGVVPRPPALGALVEAVRDARQVRDVDDQFRADARLHDIILQQQQVLRSRPTPQGNDMIERLQRGSNKIRTGPDSSFHDLYKSRVLSHEILERIFEILRASRCASNGRTPIQSAVSR